MQARNRSIVVDICRVGGGRKGAGGLLRNWRFAGPLRGGVNRSVNKSAAAVESPDVRWRDAPADNQISRTARTRSVLLSISWNAPLGGIMHDFYYYDEVFLLGSSPLQF